MAEERKNDLELCNSLVVKDFKLDEGQYPAPHDYEELRDRVSRMVSVLLDEDFEKLLLILYRIDVSEVEVKKTLAMGNPGEIASNLADLILDREMKKVETRKKYPQ